MEIKGKEYTINRATAHTTKWDKLYCQIMKDLIDYGEFTPNRTGIDTLSLPCVNFTLDLSEEFPILESKKVFTQNAITELLWIYQAQTNDINWLKERDNHIWDQWEVSEDGYWYFDRTEIDPVTNEFKVIKDRKFIGKEYAGTDGTAYGWINKHTGAVDNVLNSLKNNPRDRRMNITMWQDDYLKTAVLPSCVWSSTYKVSRDTLNANVNIRSNDMPIGNPFNVTQYAVLLSLFAKVSGFKPKTLGWNVTDCHLYVNQLEEIKLQLERFGRLEKWEQYVQTHSDEDIEYTYQELVNRLEQINKKSTINDTFKKDYEPVKNLTEEELIAFEHIITRQNPELFIADNKDFYEFDNHKKNNDIKILKYTSLPYISMPVAQ